MCAFPCNDLYVDVPELLASVAGGFGGHLGKEDAERLPDNDETKYLMNHAGDLVYSTKKCTPARRAAPSREARNGTAQLSGAGL